MDVAPTIVRRLAALAVAAVVVVGAVAHGAPDRPSASDDLPWQRAGVARIVDAVARRDVAAVAAEVERWDADPVALAWGAFLEGIADGGDRARAEAAARAVVAAATRGPDREAFARLVEDWAGWGDGAVERERRLAVAAGAAQRAVRAGKGNEAIAVVRGAEADVAASPRSPTAVWLLNLDRSVSRSGEASALADARAARARDAAAALPWPDAAAVVDLNHGIAIRRVGRSAEAEEALTAWIEQRASALSSSRLAVLRLGRCDVRMERQRFADALADARAAAQTFTANGDVGRAAGARGSAARALDRLGRPAEAAEEASAALEAARSAGNQREVARVTVLLGMLAEDAGRLPFAASRFREAAVLAAKAGQTDVQAHALANLGHVELLIGYGDAPLAALDEAMALRRRTGDLVGLVKAATLHGMVRARTDPDRAVTELRALDAEVGGRVPARQRGRILAGIAWALSSTGRSEDEEAAWLEALPLLAAKGDGDPSDLVFARASYARLLSRLGRNDEALRRLAEMGPLGPTIDVGVRSTASIAVGLARLEAGDVRGATDAIRWVAELWAQQAAGVADGEAGDRAASADRVSRYLMACAIALPADERPSAALEAVETGRAIALTDALRQRDALLVARVPPDAREADRASRAEIRRALEAFGRLAADAGARGTPALADARAAVERAYDRRRDAIARLGREARAVVESLGTRPVDLAALRRALRPGEAYLAWHVARGARSSRLVGVAVSPADAAVADLGDAPALLERVAGWSDLLSAPGSNEAALAASLYDALVRPFEPVLAGATRLVVSPFGELSFAPVGALRRVDGDGARRVIERVEVVCVPSATVFAWLRGAAPPRDGVGVVAVADPTPGPGGRPLPASREEVAGVLALHDPSRSTRWVGDDATEASLRASLDRPGARLAAVHVATHGVFDEARPRLSGLLLAKGERLLFDDVASWRVDADLAVLSGCETAKGPVRGGEGVLGFARAFFLAGVPRVVVSSWSVEDASTASFMVAFHTKLSKERLAPAAALRAVQAEYAASSGPRAHPNAWAAFALWGLPD